jgi:hypothetical protein
MNTGSYVQQKFFEHLPFLGIILGTDGKEWKQWTKEKISYPYRPYILVEGTDNKQINLLVCNKIPSKGKF